MILDGNSSGALHRIGRWLYPVAPAQIRVEVERHQFNRVQRQVPMLYAIAILNTLIVMAVCAYQGYALYTYGWMFVLILAASVRALMWSGRRAKPLSLVAISSALGGTVKVALSAITITGVWACWSYISGLFAFSVLIPISLGFGSMCIAHCLATLRPAAVGALCIGVIPVAALMIVAGDFNAKALGVSMTTVAVLMIRFVADQYDQLVTALTLEKQIMGLANTDALTKIANRRAIMAAIEAEEARCNGEGTLFGVAVLDLDEFKHVNDALGHQAGDILLEQVGARLRDGAHANDMVGRLGGDEFVILFRNVSGQDDVSARATAMLARLCQPVIFREVRLPVAASLGYATFPQDGKTASDLLHAADKALYAVKHGLKGRVAGYTGHPDTSIAA